MTLCLVVPVSVKSGMEDRIQMEQLVNLFRQIVTNDPCAVNDVTNIYRENPSLLAKKMTFYCGATSDVADTNCACVLDHETFTYILEKKIDQEILGFILRGLENGSCRHYKYRAGPHPTAVNLIHAAAASGNVPVLEILLQVHQEKPPLTYSLCASPLHLAILLNQRSSIQTILAAKHLHRYCDFFRYENRNKRNPNIIDFEHLSIFKLCTVVDDFATAETIIQKTSLRAKWVVDAMTSSSEEALNIVLRYIDTAFTKRLTEDQANTIMKYAICKGLVNVVEMILAKKRKYIGVSLALLATVYNEPKILRLILKSKSDNGKAHVLSYTLLDISDTLGHTECSEILKSTGVKVSKNNRDSPLFVILEIGKHLPYRETTDILIRKAARQTPVNIKLEGCETIIVHSLKYKHGLGIRALLAVGYDVEERGVDGLSPLQLAMKHTTHPCSLLDILYFNPCLSHFEVKGLDTLDVLSDDLPPRNPRNDTILLHALGRDLKNYSVSKREFGPSGFVNYEGSITILLIDCGYIVRTDKLIHSLYSRILGTKCRPSACSSNRNNEIRKRIFDRIKYELFRPKPLAELCRDVMRRTFTGQSWLRFLKLMNMPVSVKKFIMMDSRLKPNHQQCRFYSERVICNIEEEWKHWI